MGGYSPPVALRPLPNQIWQGSLESVGLEMALLNSQMTTLLAYPNANLSVWYPFAIGMPFLVARFFWVNGATVSGNVDVGIYDESFTRLVSAGSTAQAGASDLQQVAVTNYLLPPGAYYCAFSCDNTTATFAKSGLAAAGWAAMGALELASTFPLGAGPLSPVTFATSAYMPVAGFSSQAVL